MTISTRDHARLEQQVQDLKAAGTAFAMATVVRTLAATSAKPGDKALLSADGSVIEGWIGGGCARAAIASATRRAIESGTPQYISLRPEDLLDAEGVRAGDERDGIRFARNGCPSQGSMDVFVEPVLPLPDLVVCGSGLVADALSDLAALHDFNPLRCISPGAQPIDRRTMEGFDFSDHVATAPFVVIATQGKGDLAALRSALSYETRYLGFVGSRRKFATLSQGLVTEYSAERLARVHAPAGLDINAITPQEIALSIMAEIIALRRRRDRPEASSTGS
ncbi:MAG: XdhC family protein [Pseudomonadota bacterium]